ncbi:hypothetical protein FACS1894106_0300 [Spirochaetia bacterium]|nr:hypothetical protein FACS1894106_0300 [Spirochaetia bacterium]
MKKLVLVIAFLICASFVHASGILDSHSGKFKNFSYLDGSINRNARTEYIGFYWKTFYVDGTRQNASMVVAGNFMPWNSHEYTGWEELAREPAPYADMDDVRAALNYITSINISEMDGRLYFLELVPDSDGNYFWIDADGDWGFYQDVYVKR